MAEQIAPTKFKVRIQRIHKAASRLTLDYFYRENNVFLCKDIAMNTITHEEFKVGTKKHKTILLTEKEYFKDIEITHEEKIFLARHPFVKFDGNPNMNNCTVEMIDVQDKGNKEVIEIKKRKELMNIIDNANVKEIYNMCNYIQLNVSGMDMNDIYLLLLNTNDGLAYSNYDKIKMYEKDADATMKVVINKALILNIVDKRTDGFYFGNKIIAASLDELLFFCKNNEEIYKVGIEKVVAEKEVNLPITIQYTENFELGNKELKEKIEEEKNATTITDADVAWAKAELEKLGVKGLFAMKPSTLIDRVNTYPELKRQLHERIEAEKSARKIAIPS